jgi:signal transduction histidine kinase/ActR/RegA family two-component response regulator
MGIPLRRRLFALAAAAIAPVALMAAIGLYALEQQQEDQSERVGVELARSVANAVDTELRSTVAILEALGTTPSLDTEDLAAFRERARRVLGVRPAWTAIWLARPDGTPLADTRVVVQGDLFPLSDTESFRTLVRTRAPVVGHLTWHPTGEWLFAVRVPVLRDDAIRYVVSALVRPAVIRDVLTRQNVPEDWVISIVDARGLRVARSRAHEENLAGRLSETAQRVVAEGPPDEGFGMSTTLEGERTFTPYSRVASSGWLAVLGIPTTQVRSALYRSMAVFGGGLLLSIALGTLGAVWAARGITRPIAELRDAADALGRREPVQPPATDIREIRDVGGALTQAAAALRQAESEREDLLQKERQAREAAEAADRAKEEFMAVLSHELRTPLNAVYGWARMLQSGQLTDEGQSARALDAIVRNADVQVQLIDELLDLSRISSGKMRLDVRPVDVPAVLLRALDTVRPAADARDIRIHADLDPDAGSINGDPGRLQQIAWNLLMNAVKFTPRGGEVTIAARRRQSSVEIVVRDTGQGIAPEILPHVFERFRQADSSSTRRHGGLGLGLALVKHLVELHGGSVRVESDGIGRGATFVVMLPIPAGAVVADSVPRVHAGALPVESLATIVRLDGRRVLAVDDDPEALALARTILIAAGAEVQTCDSAGGALAIVQSWRPHVVVSDIEMPGEDGYALIRRLRALPADAGGQTPAIALTAYGRPQDRVSVVEAGFTMHVPKPVDPGELTAIVAAVSGE